MNGRVTLVTVGVMALLLFIGAFTGHTRRVVAWFFRFDQAFRKKTWRPEHWVMDDAFHRKAGLPHLDLSGCVWMMIALFFLVIIVNALIARAVG